MSNLFSAEEDAYIINHYSRLSIDAIAKHLGRTKGSVYSRARKRLWLRRPANIQAEIYQVVRSATKNKRTVTANNRPTLCWDCKNAVPSLNGAGCDWSKKGLPVNGWTETRNLRYNNSKRSRSPTPSFLVTECPEFIEG